MGREFLSDLRLESAIPRAKQYMNRRCVDVAIREILDPLISAAYRKKLAQSYIDKFKIEKTGFLKIQLVNDHPISRYLEYGTEPHKITAQDGGELAFNWEGENVFFHSVKHPGFKGYGILEEILDKLAFNYAKTLSKEASAYLWRAKMK